MACGCEQMSLTSSIVTDEINDCSSSLSSNKPGISLTTRRFSAFNAAAIAAAAVSALIL